MAKITMFTCDCCKEDYKDEPMTGQSGGAEIQLSGTGPVDRPMGKNIHYTWKDLCPKCLTQFRDGLLKIAEARKQHLDATVNDSTKSPTTQQVERAENKGRTEERARCVRVLQDQIAGFDAVIELREKEGADDDTVRRTKVMRDVVQVTLNEMRKG